MSSTSNKRGRDTSPETGIRRNPPAPLVLEPAAGESGSSGSQEVLHDVVGAWKSFVLSELERTEELVRNQRDVQLEAAKSAQAESEPTGLVECPLDTAHSTINQTLGTFLDITYAGSRAFWSKWRKETNIPSLEERQEAVDMYSAMQYKPWRWRLTAGCGSHMDTDRGPPSDRRTSVRERQDVPDRQRDKRLAGTLPDAISIAESLFSECLDGVNALKARLEEVTDGSYRSNRKPHKVNFPAGNTQESISVDRSAGVTRESLFAKLDVCQHDWLMTAARSLRPTDIACYFARLTSAVSAPEYEKYRARDYVVDRDAFNVYYRSHMFRTGGRQDDNGPDSLESFLSGLERIKQVLDKKTLSDRYFHLVGSKILARGHPPDLWYNFFSSREVEVKKSVDDGNLSSIASALRADFTSYYETWRLHSDF